MDKKLLRDYAIELVGTFLFVLAASASVCMNYVTLPEGMAAGVSPLTRHQPGVVGMALAQGLVLAVLLAVTAPVSGGYLNPAITITLWLLNRIPTPRASWLIGGQLLGGFLAGLCLRYGFEKEILELAHFGAPHVNPLAYRDLLAGSLWAGAGVELILTFLLALAIFGARSAQGPGPHTAWLAGAAVAASVLIAYPLTGAAMNPARWFGPVAWEAIAKVGREPFRDAFVYIAGPIAGAALAGWWCTKVVAPGREV